LKLFRILIDILMCRSRNFGLLKRLQINGHSPAARVSKSILIL